MKRYLLEVTCSFIAATCLGALIFLIYTLGQINGMHKGFALGMKDADVYKQRAEECEGK